MDDGARMVERETAMNRMILRALCGVAVVVFVAFGAVIAFAFPTAGAMQVLAFLVIVLAVVPAIVLIETFNGG